MFKRIGKYVKARERGADVASITTRTHHEATATVCVRISSQVPESIATKGGSTARRL